jgi:hypothetical protein
VLEESHALVLAFEHAILRVANVLHITPPVLKTATANVVDGSRQGHGGRSEGKSAYVTVTSFTLASPTGSSFLVTFSHTF